MIIFQEEKPVIEKKGEHRFALLRTVYGDLDNSVPYSPEVPEKYKGKLSVDMISGQVLAGRKNVKCDFATTVKQIIQEYYDIEEYWDSDDYGPAEKQKSYTIAIYIGKDEKKHPRSNKEVAQNKLERSLDSLLPYKKDGLKDILRIGQEIVDAAENLMMKLPKNI